MQRRTSDQFNSSFFDNASKSFESIEEMNRMVQYVSCALHKMESPLLVSKLAVEYSATTESVQLKLDHTSSSIIIIAPTLMGETPKQRQIRAEEYLTRFAPALYEIRFRIFMTIYNSLKPSARKKIISAIRDSHDRRK